MILNFCSKLWAKTVLCAQFRSTGGVWCSAWAEFATNIATFHLCWDGTQYVPEGKLEEWSDNFHWIFNK